MVAAAGVVERRRDVILLIAAALALSPPAEPPVTELEYINAVLARSGLREMTQDELNQRKAYSDRFAREYEGQRLKSAGFRPAEELRKARRTLVRATFTEPRLFMRMPGVTLERGEGGRLRVTLSSDGRAKRGSAVVPGSQWKSLQTLEAAAFQQDPPPAPAPWLSWERGDPVPQAPQSVCHGWGTTLERITPAEVKKVYAHGCSREDLAKARLAYAQQIAQVAVSAFPQCRRGDDPFEALATCFGTFDPATSANP
jgi:hypothetical protein